MLLLKKKVRKGLGKNIVLTFDSSSEFPSSDESSSSFSDDIDKHSSSLLFKLLSEFMFFAGYALFFFSCEFFMNIN